LKQAGILGKLGNEKWIPETGRNCGETWEISEKLEKWENALKANEVVYHSSPFLASNDQFLVLRV